jgi:hypothetical protein
MGKELGKLYHELTPKENKKYEQIFLTEKKRYVLEKQQYDKKTIGK